jgi:hypothetical protein
MVSNWKKKRMTLKFVDSGSYNRNEREGNYHDKRRMERKNNIKTLGTGICAGLKTLYIN